MLKDRAVAVGEAIGGSDIAKSAVEANLVVMVDEGFGDSFGIVEGQRRFWADGLFLERAMEAFDLAVALRIVR